MYTYGQARVLYNGLLPQTLYFGHTGLETLLHRLVLGGEYKNICQIIKTVQVIGILQGVSNPLFIDQVTVLTPEGIMTDNSAALIVGTATLCLLISFPLTKSTSDCTGFAATSLK